jgi:hypothetical protein
MAGGAVTLTPSASNTSALPDRLETERFPCFATFTPQAATTSAAHVEILNVPDRSRRPAGIEDAFRATRERNRVRAHGSREPDDLRRALPFHREPDEQPRDLRIAGPPLHDFRHGRGRLIAREVFTAD